MRTILQRVERAAVCVEGETIAEIGPGLLAFVGVERGDESVDAEVLARKVVALRCFPGRTPMDQTVGERGGAVLVVSQFTLLASMRRGNRPSFERSEAPALAAERIEHFAAVLRAAGLHVEEGRFGAAMSVSLVNDGPVTFLLACRHGRLVEEPRP